MIKCHDCQYWLPVNYGPSGFGECKHQMLQDSDNKVIKDDGIVMDGNPYHPVFVGPNFGCVHGERKI